VQPFDHLEENDSVSEMDCGAKNRDFFSETYASYKGNAVQR
jgi:hypothetical protein